MRAVGGIFPRGKRGARAGEVRKERQREKEGKTDRQGELAKEIGNTEEEPAGYLDDSDVSRPLFLIMAFASRPRPISVRNSLTYR